MAYTPDSIEAIGFNFTKFDGPRGEFPEPTQDQVDAFRAVVVKWTTGVAAMEQGKATEAKARKNEDLILNGIVALAGDSLTREQLDALPPRHRIGFVRYVVGELLDPTERTAGTTRSPAVLNGAGSPT